MSRTVCLAANTLYYPQGGGHMWVFLNWALGLRAAGCRVIWLETAGTCGNSPEQELQAVTELKQRLERYGFADAVALASETGEPLDPDVAASCRTLDEAAAGADLLLNPSYDTAEAVVSRFQRKALLDIDPGLLQTWMSGGEIRPAPHDIYFTIGETVGTPQARVPHAGITWHYTPPCVFVDAWPVCDPPPGGPFTTISHWYQEGEWIEDANGDSYCNQKREGFVPYLDLPSQTAARLELALCLDGDDEERAELEARGWIIRESVTVSSTPWDYQRYIQGSAGEFSCVKPSCVRFQNAWISDRTLCFLASGRPAVIEHTGPSRILPDRAGLLRFRTPAEAVERLDEVMSDYARHSRLARELAVQVFDAKQAATRLLERALG